MAKLGLIRLGEIVKPHGLKGEVCVHCDADSPFIFAALRAIYLLKPKAKLTDKPLRMKLRSWRLHQNRPMLSLEGVDDRDAAEALRGLLVLVTSTELPALNDEQVYLHELQGCEVFLQDGRRLGRIDHYLFPSSEQEIWSILTDSGREILLPAHPQTVRDIDLDARRVLVEPPEGLLELYLGE